MCRDKAERRWWVRQLIIAVNIIVLGVTFYADAVGIKLDAFVWAAGGFQGASAAEFYANEFASLT